MTLAVAFQIPLAYDSGLHVLGSASLVAIYELLQKITPCANIANQGNDYPAAWVGSAGESRPNLAGLLCRLERKMRNLPLSFRDAPPEFGAKTNTDMNVVALSPFGPFYDLNQWFRVEVEPGHSSRSERSGTTGEYFPGAGCLADANPVTNDAY